MEAEKMLHIAKTSLNMLQTVEDQDQVEVLWIAAITALRGVGHVLAKVDKYSNTILSQKIDDWWIDLNKNKTTDMWRILKDSIAKGLKRLTSFQPFLLNTLCLWCVRTQ